VVADAGDTQTFEPGAMVELDGSESSGESGRLGYQWTKVGGRAVSLQSPQSAHPAFTAPVHPAVLRFSLTVSEGSTTSAPDTVTIRLPAVDPTPHAVVGPEQTVDSHTAVTLDGAESWDPLSQPLEYAWLQTGGPRVDLRGSDTATPSFDAPRGPARPTFDLTVFNGTDASPPATVAVNVNGIAPGFRSADAIAFIAGEHASFDVRTEGSPAPRSRSPAASSPTAPRGSPACPGPRQGVLAGLPARVRCTSHGASQVTCHAAGRQVLVVVGAGAPPRRSVRLEVTIATPAGTVKRTLKVRVQSPSRWRR
jgi:hypothetical protein